MTTIIILDLNDFDSSPRTITFPADVGMDTVTDLSVPIPVTDDDVDEADDQFFIAQLVVVDAISRSHLVIARSNTNCIIVDNDRKLQIEK